MSIEDQPPPVANGSKPIWDLVIQDMQERDRVGRARYGMPLQAFNGRDPLVDAYQEALDLVVYLRQAIEERGWEIIRIPSPFYELRPVPTAIQSDPCPESTSNGTAQTLRNSRGPTSK